MGWLLDRVALSLRYCNREANALPILLSPLKGHRPSQQHEAFVEVLPQILLGGRFVSNPITDADFFALFVVPMLLHGDLGGFLGELVVAGVKN